MIQIEAIRIVDLRGIRDLVLRPMRQNFVISGPNGSGKSGVVDAIQFGLTGAISRLAGKGTGTLTVQRHGPHVDRRDDSAGAEVSLTLYFPDLDKTAVLTRNVKTARNFSLTPDDAAVRAVLEEVARHPDLTLSRREIIRYILVEAGQRSKEIQALLKLEEIDDVRSVLKTASNQTTRAHKAAQQNTEQAAADLLGLLEAIELTEEDILAPVNERRKTLGLTAIDHLCRDTVLNANAAQGDPHATFNKATAIRDLDALRKAASEFAGIGSDEVAAIVADLATLERDPALLEMLRQRSFVETGHALVSGPRCPLCDVEWEDEEHLRKHLQTKLSKSQHAEDVQTRLLNNAAVIAGHAHRIAKLLAPVRSLASSDGSLQLAQDLADWEHDLGAFAKCLTTVEAVLNQNTRFRRGWLRVPSSFTNGIVALVAAIRDKADQNPLAEAHSFLTLAQDRLISYREVQAGETGARNAANVANLTYETYCAASEQHLTALYAAVENDLGDFYREINSSDERGFKAKFHPIEGKLGLEVAFYDRGMFPPGAYHSEGHQDGMGVCLYLALMKRLLGNRFRLAVLDDVVMSVDRDHRKQFCRLLKARFPDTQFIITTHDKVWAKQMQTEGLVKSKSGIAFQSWSVQTGPIFEQITGIWDEIERDLANNDVETAASRLRRHLEFIAGEVADQLGAKPTYRGDFSYDLGDLLPAAISRHGELLRIAAKSANDWANEHARDAVASMKKVRSEILTKCGGEQWIINTAIHYNEGASFTTAEFRAVLEGFRALLSQFRCPKPECDSWLYVTPRKGDPEVLRCNCMAVNLNLKPK